MRMKQLFAGVLISSILLSAGSGCSKKSGNKSGISTIKNDDGDNAIFEMVSSKKYKGKSSDEDLQKAYSEFAIGLIHRCAEDAGDENFMVSTDSVLFALEMTAAGADGDTLDQMLETLLPGADKDDAFLFAVDRMAQLKSSQLQTANSVWLNEKTKGGIYSNYLNYVEKHFDAKIDAVPFNDKGVSQINSWVDDNTNGMIPQLIDKLDEEDVMVLVNALAFDAKWKKPFEKENVNDGTFHRGDGTTETCKFLSGKNDVCYLHNDKATGFYKLYEGGQYAFMVMLPGEPGEDFPTIDDILGGTSSSKKKDTYDPYKTMDINEFVAEMTAEDYWQFVQSGNSDDVDYAFPQFTSEYSTSLKDILKDMGMEDAFSPSNADFGNMSDIEPLSIGDVIHKTKIEVTPEGTKAASSTGVIMEHNDVIMHREVICNRPFAYAIIDMETRLPIFFGTVEKVEE